MRERRTPMSVLQCGGAGLRNSVSHTSPDRCQRLRFVPPSPSGGEGSGFSEVCHAYGIEVVDGDDPWQLLMAAASAPCGGLACLPPVAAVRRTGLGTGLPGITDQPLVVLAVLARCCGSVFLRDRSPLVEIATLTTETDILIPANWSPNA